MRSLNEAFISGEVMDVELEVLLRGYASGLIVMQLLESRHHLMGQHIIAGRASLPSATCTYQTH